MKNCSPCCACKFIFAVVIIGSFNWLLVGLGYFAGFSGNLVANIFGNNPTIENLIYLAVGLCGVAMAAMHGNCKCSTKK